ncbi:flagellar type III secretion system protein FlhB [Methylocystis sp. WRRC1]|uniref:EscU/YscU/HrcU family type III secretion system export apparatus switch protein n=1 Tax=Methylocystis sp. WRRC1 TaxID=1732014 RepID=UPI001D14B866|nr:flagellar type III secretion system protein FlhB [Methylocystis sp. WRRC1]
MSESDDPESRTEEATEKKIRDTVEQGKLPSSRDVGAAFGIFALLGAFSFLVDALTPRLIEALGLLIANVGELPLRSGADAYRYVSVVNLELGRYLGPILLGFVIAGLVASFTQGAPQFVFDRVQPDLSRISIIAGWKRIFGLAGVVELFKSVVKMIIVGGAVIFAGLSDHAALVDAMRTDPSRLPALTLRLIIHLTSVVAISVGVLAAADFVWARFKWRRDLRMSRQELKEEFKQAEGDPLVKARMRSLAMDRSRRRMMASVPNATFVVANPTHYAIALRYVREEGGAPLVLAKGKDLIALKIREIAERNNVPVFEKKELARAMYDMVEVDRMIPTEFYRPVAELIHFLSSAAARR